MHIIIKNYQNFRIYTKIKTRAFLSKVVVESLLDAQEADDQLEYEDLLAIIERADVPEDLSQLSNEILVNNASFVVGQVSLIIFFIFLRIVYEILSTPLNIAHRS